MSIFSLSLSTFSLAILSFNSSLQKKAQNSSSSILKRKKNARTYLIYLWIIALIRKSYALIHESYTLISRKLRVNSRKFRINSRKFRVNSRKLHVNSQKTNFYLMSLIGFRTVQILLARLKFSRNCSNSKVKVTG